MEKQEVYLLGEAAALLRVSKRHLQRLIAGGVIKAVRLGRSTRIARLEIERLLGHPLDEKTPAGAGGER